MSVLVQLAVDQDTFDAAQALSIASGLPVSTVLSRILLETPALPAGTRPRARRKPVLRAVGAACLAGALMLGATLWLRRTTPPA
jgi:hypothetical protein